MNVDPEAKPGRFETPPNAIYSLHDSDTLSKPSVPPFAYPKMGIMAAIPYRLLQG